MNTAVFRKMTNISRLPGMSSMGKSMLGASRMGGCSCGGGGQMSSLSNMLDEAGSQV